MDIILIFCVIEHKAVVIIDMICHSWKTESRDGQTSSDPWPHACLRTLAASSSLGSEMETNEQTQLYKAAQLPVWERERQRHRHRERLE